MKPIDDDEPVKPRRLDFHYPLFYVTRTWLDHRKFGTYPRVGGYDAQDPLLVLHDWGLLDERYGLAYGDLKAHKDGEGLLDALLRDSAEAVTMSGRFG